MNVKFPILFAAAAAMMFGSCSSNDDPQNKEEKTEPVENPAAAYNIIKPETTANFFVNDAELTANAAVNAFGYRFFASAADIEGVDNLSVSPLSASMALSLLANSADDELTSSINDLLGVANLDDLNSLNTKIISYLSKERDRARIELANSVWYADGLTVNDQYIEDINNKYFSEVYKTDFTAAETPAYVDGWVALKTHDVIPTISDVIDFKSISAALFINALYFTGEWDSQFNTKDNTTESFFGLKATSTVEMMHNSGLCVYGKTSEGEYLEKDFCDGTMMTIFMPVAGADFKDICLNLTAEKMSQIKKASERSIVTLSMPKFKNQKTINGLGEIFGKMGHGDLYGKLSKMGLDFGCTLDQAVQKTAIDVDEDGLTLAAVTAILMYGATGDPEPEYKEVSMTVDRPFIYTVTNRSTGSILLMGTVTDF